MKIAGENYRTIWFEPVEKVVKIIDQTKLPFDFEIISLNNFIEAFNAIKEMKVRGAPLIGATAAYALYLASNIINSDNSYFFAVLVPILYSCIAPPLIIFLIAVCITSRSFSTCDLPS